MSAKRCAECGRYLDGLTDGAEEHPLYKRHCVQCGEIALKEDGGWTMGQQIRRERAHVYEIDDD